ncbi:MAG: methyltransferase domain-containing protein [Coriobacteriia bacterium]|nr:methyltransferase domain-containing protein [Coriobacteriia bacterium]
MSVAPARRSALAVLGRVRKDGAFGGAALASELKKAHLSADDVALVTRLVYGVLGTEGVLDEVLDRLVRGTVEPRIRDVLRLAAYELLYGRAPAYAVVDQAVDAARHVRPQAAGLVNAVTRRVSEIASGFPWGDPTHDRDVLARVSACPRWIVDEHISSLGLERGLEALLACAAPAPSYVRLDPFDTVPGEAHAALAPAMPSASPPDPECFVLGRPSALYGAADVGGWFSMDAAAQMAPAACAPAPGMRVLDVGAGRGNKTVCLQALAVRAGGPADITALEINAGKATRLRERLDGSHVPGVTVEVGDAGEAARWSPGGSFDVVLLDAPCTGLGTLRRYPEKRWRLTASDIGRMVGLQERLLTGVAAAVRPGGRVVYSTCSVARAENEGVVQAFLSAPAGRGFRLEPLGELVPDAWDMFMTGDGMFRSWPTAEGPDGHFVAVLRRDGA